MLLAGNGYLRWRFPFQVGAPTVDLLMALKYESIKIGTTFFCYYCRAAETETRLISIRHGYMFLSIRRGHIQKNKWYNIIKRIIKMMKEAPEEARSF